MNDKIENEKAQEPRDEQEVKPEARGGTADEKTPTANANESESAATNEKTEKPKRKKLSGDYWYVETDEAELAKQSFIRTLFTVIGLLLQLVVLLFPQGGLEYITKNIPSYAYVYMWFVFVMLGVSIYVIIMNFTRYKLQKRIPKERAPKNGFKRRSFLGAEILIAVYAVIFVMELSFVCLSFDGWGLTGMFISLLAAASAVAARQTTVLALRSAELITAEDKEAD